MLRPSDPSIWDNIPPLSVLSYQAAFHITLEYFFISRTKTAFMDHPAEIVWNHAACVSEHDENIETPERCPWLLGIKKTYNTGDQMPLHGPRSTQILSTALHRILQQSYEVIFVGSLIEHLIWKIERIDAETVTVHYDNLESIFQPPASDHNEMKLVQAVRLPITEQIEDDHEIRFKRRAVHCHLRDGTG